MNCDACAMVLTSLAALFAMLCGGDLALTLLALRGGASEWAVGRRLGKAGMFLCSWLAVAVLIYWTARSGHIGSLAIVLAALICVRAVAVRRAYRLLLAELMKGRGER